MPSEEEIEEEELEEDEYYASANKNSKDTDKQMAWLFTIVGLGALNVLNNGLSGDEKAARQSFVISQTRGAIASSLSSSTSTVIRELPVIPEASVSELYYLNPLELDRYNQILQETMQYSRITDPNTVENIAFNQQQQIVDQVGMFGGVESEKQGVLSQYLEEKVMIPWETEKDDSVCEDCQDLEAGSPYSPERYPEPPHYGCRCSPGEPIAITIASEDFPD